MYSKKIVLLHRLQGIRPEPRGSRDKSCALSHCEDLRFSSISLQWFDFRHKSLYYINDVHSDKDQSDDKKSTPANKRFPFLKMNQSTPANNTLEVESTLQEYTRYVAYLLLFIGTVGNTLNIYLLSAIRSYRSQPSMFYFLIASIFNNIIFTVGLVSRLLESGYGLKWLDSSLLWCRSRHYIITSFPIIPFYCQCFATIAQFCVTSQTARLRQQSTIQRAHWISICLSIVALLHGIPFFLCYDIPPMTRHCTCDNSALMIYFPLFVLVSLLFIPTSLTIIFGYLTYRNISQSVGLSHQHADRQLALMVCMQIFLIVAATIPYGLYHFYSFSTRNTVKGPSRLTTELLLSTIFSLNTYVYSGVSSSSLQRANRSVLVSGKFLRVSGIVESLSSHGEASYLLLAKTKSDDRWMTDDFCDGYVAIDSLH